MPKGAVGVLHLTDLQLQKPKKRGCCEERPSIQTIKALASDCGKSLSPVSSASNGHVERQVPTSDAAIFGLLEDRGAHDQLT